MAKKRSNGEGSVHRTKSGRWVGQLMDGYTEDGKRKIVSFSGDTKGETLDKIRNYRNQEATAATIDKKLRLGDWADTWYADYRTQVQPSTYAGYKYTLSIIKRHMGNRKLCDVLPLHINRFMDELMKANYSISLIQKCRAMLIQIFNGAEGNGLVEKNPATRAKIIRSQQTAQPQRQKDAFTDKEVDILCAELENTVIGNSIRLMLNTGLRAQELLALSSDDIAEDGSTVSVTKAIQMVDGVPQLGPPKSKRSRRTVPVPQHCRNYALFLRRHGCGDLIWKWSGEKPYYPVSAFRHRYYMAVKEHGRSAEVISPLLSPYLHYPTTGGWGVHRADCTTGWSRQHQRDGRLHPHLRHHAPAGGCHVGGREEGGGVNDRQITPPR